MNSNDGLVPSLCQPRQTQLLLFQPSNMEQHSPGAAPAPLTEAPQTHIGTISMAWPAAGARSRAPHCWLQQHQADLGLFSGCLQEVRANVQVLCYMGCSTTFWRGEAFMTALAFTGSGLDA